MQPFAAPPVSRMVRYAGSGQQVLHRLHHRLRRLARQEMTGERDHATLVVGGQGVPTVEGS